jgi:PIN domain nuclease of toxin-antitoxin system
MPERGRYVLDTSALLAALFGEPGEEVLRSAGPGAIMSAVNMSEFLAKCSDRGVPETLCRKHVRALGIVIVAFDEAQCEAAASLRAPTRHENASFADRACLALARSHALPVYTTDKVWSGLSEELGIDIRQLR